MSFLMLMLLMLVVFLLDRACEAALSGVLDVVVAVVDRIEYCHCFFLQS